MCVVLAVSLFAGCAHFESIEYSQEISEENPETIEAFDQFINDIFETEVTENTINLHFTISDPEKYGITDYPVTLGDLSNDAMSDSNARLENYLSGLSSFSYTELTLNQQLTYDILENYFQLQLDMADMYLYDELLRPSTGVQAQLPILYEEYSFNSKKDVEDYLKLLAGRMSLEVIDTFCCGICDIYEKKNANGRYLIDGLHPNAAGAKKIGVFNASAVIASYR